MRPNALKANRTLTPLEEAELLDVLLGAGVLEVLELEGLEDVLEPGAGVEVGPELKVTPCAESGEI